jgi:hypothetical protein
MQRLQGIVSEIPTPPVATPVQEEKAPMPIKPAREFNAYSPYSYGRMMELERLYAREQKMKRLESFTIKVSIALTLVFFCGFITTEVLGNKAPSVEWQKTYVYPGDTMWELIKEYNPDKASKYDMRDLIQIMTEHNGNSSRIQAGSMINVPILK